MAAHQKIQKNLSPIQHFHPISIKHHQSAASKSVQSNPKVIPITKSPATKQPTTKRPVNRVTHIYRPLCYWLLDCVGGFVVGMDFGLFELICQLLIGGVWWRWGGNAVLESGFYAFCDELPLILALFKLSQQVSACLLLLLQAACKRFCRVFKINCN